MTLGHMDGLLTTDDIKPWTKLQRTWRTNVSRHSRLSTGHGIQH